MEAKKRALLALEQWLGAAPISAVIEPPPHF
jgi:hypothetical protein